MYHLYFNKNLLWEIVSDAFGPNWDCRKESFPTFIIQEQIVQEKNHFNSYVENITRARFGILKSPKRVEST